MIEHLTTRVVRVILCEANARVETKLSRAGILAGPAAPALTPGIPEAVALAAVSASTIADQKLAGAPAKLPRPPTVP